MKLLLKSIKTKEWLWRIQKQNAPWRIRKKGIVQKVLFYLKKESLLTQIVDRFFQRKVV